MKLIIGLGNPGRKYEATRHNIGRHVTENLASQYQLSFLEQRKLKAFTAEGSIASQPVVIAYLSTYMNLSGEGVLRLSRHYGIDFQKELLVVVDDYALPFGKLRLRAQGSSGGHNGLESIAEMLQSANYPRLRVGIGIEGDCEAAHKQELAEYVLLGFDAKEKKQMPLILKAAVQAGVLWLEKPMEQAMSVING